MSFNGSGTWVPPAGQPVASGTVIQSTTHNTLVTDIGNSFNNTLPRDGQAPMQGQLKITDGTSSIPGIGFNSEASTGMFRPAPGVLGLSVSGVEGLRVNSAGRIVIGSTADDGTNKLQVNGPAKVTGAATLASTLNVAGATTLATLGVTGATNLSSLSTSGSATVGTTLNVSGNVTVSGLTNLSSLSTLGGATVGTTLNVIGVASASSFNGSLTGNVSGNATTATKLQTARTINGVVFDGSASIQLPVPVSGANGYSKEITGADLNTILQTGFYRGSGMSNAPNAGWFYVTVEGHDDAWTKQTATTYGSGNVANYSWMRTKMNGGWSNWSKFSEADFGTDYTIKRRMSRYHTDDGTSIDNVQSPETGFDYNTSKSGFAGPFIHFGGLGGVVANGYTAPYGCQIMASYVDGKSIKFRTKMDDATPPRWNPWFEFLHSGNTDIQVSPVANSVVRRQENGYIMGNYINMTDDSGNAGIGGTGNGSPVSAIIVKQGDSYYRGVSAQKVKDYLNLATLTNMRIPDGDNLNNYQTPGFYAIGVNTANSPGNYGQLLVMANPNHDTVTQIYGDYASSRLFVRSSNGWGQVWQPWRMVAWTDNDTLNNPTIRGYYEGGQVLGANGALTLDPRAGTNIEIALNGNSTITLPAAIAGMSYTVTVYFNGPFSLTFTGGSSLRWAGGAAPASTSVPGRMDKYVFTCGAGGWYTLGQDGGRNF